MKFVSNLYRKLFDYITPTERRTCGIACQKCRTGSSESERDCCRKRVNEVFWHNWHTNLSGMTHQLTATAAAAAAAWGPWQKFNWPFFLNFCFCLVFLKHFYFHFHFALQVYHVIERPRCVYALSLNLMWIELNYFGWFVYLATVSITLCFSV